MIAYLPIFFLLLLQSCGQKPTPQSQKATLSLARDPTILDPQKARDLYSITLLHMLFEGLTRTSKNGETELALAKSVEVLDGGCRYIFHLRKSVWSNGDPVTARDFESSWKTILDPHFATDISYQLYPIKNALKAKQGEVGADAIGVRATGDSTLIVDLEQPVPYFLELVSMPSFFPSASKSVSNGPFLLSEWKHSDHLLLSKNERYWESTAVSLSSVDFVIAAPDTALQMYEEGKLDWIGFPLCTIPSDAIQNLKQRGCLQESSYLATYFYRINTSPEIGMKKNPLSDPRVRRAMGRAIDRERIVKYVLKGGEKAARSLTPPEMGLEVEDSFAEAQFPESGPITISYCSSERNALIAQAVQKQWEEAFGIEVLLEAVEPKTFFQRISKKEYQIAAGQWMADFNDPINFLEVFKYKDSGTNNTAWENSEYIDLLNASAVCMNREERLKILSSAEQVLMEEMPILPVFYYVLNYLKQPQLSGVALSPIGQLDLRWAYFEPECKEKL
jgi:oligopeptide transport system substrate-binding protein